jgi:hypothetical protein
MHHIYFHSRLDFDEALQGNSAPEFKQGNSPTGPLSNLVFNDYSPDYCRINSTLGEYSIMASKIP